MKGPLCDKQHEVIAFYNKHQPQHLILEGSVRSGKTYADLLLWNSHVYSFEKPSKDFIITGYTIGSIERNIIKPFSEMLGVSIKLDQFGRFDLGPHKVNCFGSDNQNSFKSMQGMTGHGWYGNEITQQHRNTLTEAFHRCSGEGFRVFWDTNPDAPNHPIKINYIDKSGLADDDGNLLIKSFNFRLEDNELLPPAYVANIKRTTPPGAWYDRRILGQWVAAEGVIFNNWKMIPEIPENVKLHSRRTYGLDFGFSVEPAVLIDVYFNGDEIWLDELLYSTGINNAVLAIEMDKLIDRDIQIYADSAEPKSIDELCAHGFNVHGATKGPDSVRVGIDWLLGKQIYVTERSKNAQTELQNYAWKMNKDGDKLPVPIDAYDHILDSLRYASNEFIDTWKGRVSEVDASELGL